MRVNSKVRGCSSLYMDRTGGRLFIRLISNFNKKETTHEVCI